MYYLKQFGGYDDVRKDLAERYEKLSEDKQWEVCVLVHEWDSYNKDLEAAITEVEKNGVKRYLGHFRTQAEVGEYLVHERNEFPELEGLDHDSRIFSYIDYESVAGNYIGAGVLYGITWKDETGYEVPEKVWYFTE